MRFRERSAASPAQLETGILPMINVVFLLLIFFMLTGHLSAIDPFEVSPPQTESEGIAESDDMLMLIGPYGRVAVDGDDIPREELADYLAARARQNPDLRVRIKADDGTEALLLVDIMRVMREAGIQQMQLLASPGAN